VLHGSDLLAQGGMTGRSGFPSGQVSGESFASKEEGCTARFSFCTVAQLVVPREG
jgi:hypothetical protein